MLATASVGERSGRHYLQRPRPLRAVELELGALCKVAAAGGDVGGHARNDPPVASRLRKAFRHPFA